MRRLGTTALLAVVASLCLAACGADQSDESTADLGGATPDLTEQEVCSQLFPKHQVMSDIAPIRAFIDKGGAVRMRAAKGALVGLEVLAPRAPAPLAGQIDALHAAAKAIVDEVEEKGTIDADLADYKAAGVALSATCVGYLESEPAPEAAPELAGPLFSVTSSCENDYPVVLDPATMSLVATAFVTNDGDQTGRAKVVASWYPVGGQPYRLVKTVRLAAGETKRVPFKVAPGQSVINGMVGLQHGDEMCTVSAKPAG